MTALAIVVYLLVGFAVAVIDRRYETDPVDRKVPIPAIVWMLLWPFLIIEYAAKALS